MADIAKQNIKTFVKEYVGRVKHSEMSCSSVRIAYFVMLSLFPMIVTIGAALPLFHIDPNSVIPYLDSIIPHTVFDVIEPEILSLLTAKSGGALSLGIIGTVWAASAGMKVIQEGIDSAYGLNKTRHFITSAIVPVLIFILIILLVLIFIVVFGFGRTVLQFLFREIDSTEGLVKAIGSLKLPVSFLALFFTFTLIYKLTPNIRHSVKDVLAGALFATVSLIVLVEGFTIYQDIMSAPALAGGLGGAPAAYGILGAVFGLGLWLRLLGYVILLGAALNAQLYERRHGTPQKKQNRADDYIVRVAGKIFKPKRRQGKAE